MRAELSLAFLVLAAPSRAGTAARPVRARGLAVRAAASGGAGRAPALARAAAVPVLAARAAAPAPLPRSAVLAASRAPAPSPQAGASAPRRDPRYEGPPEKGLASAALRLRRFLLPKIVASDFDGLEGRHYHGTSFATLVDMVRSGGLAGLSNLYLAPHPGYSHSYAVSGARARGGLGVVLEFEPGEWSRDLKIDRPLHPPDPHGTLAGIPNFMISPRPVPLKFLSERSKRAILDWMRAQRDAGAGDAPWDELVPRFEAAFYPPVSSS